MSSLNDLIEKNTGDYINTLIHIYSIQSFDDNKFYFTSLESYIWSKNNKLALLNYEKLLPNITSEIISGETPKEYLNLKQIINTSPITTENMIIFRGLSINLNIKEGDIFYHKNFIWGSFHKNYAEMFMYDTSNCYQNNMGFNGISKKKKGCLLKINIPKNINYFERIINIDFAPNDTKSEIILNPCYLKVEFIHDDCIEMTIVK